MRIYQSLMKGKMHYDNVSPHGKRAIAVHSVELVSKVQHLVFEKTGQFETDDSIWESGNGNWIGLF